MGYSSSESTEIEENIVVDLAAFYNIKEDVFDFENDFQNLTDLFTDSLIAQGSVNQARYEFYQNLNSG